MAMLLFIFIFFFASGGVIPGGSQENNKSKEPFPRKEGMDDVEEWTAKIFLFAPPPLLDMMYVLLRSSTWYIVHRTLYIGIMIS